MRKKHIALGRFLCLGICQEMRFIFLQNNRNGPETFRTGFWPFQKLKRFGNSGTHYTVRFRASLVITGALKREIGINDWGRRVSEGLIMKILLLEGCGGQLYILPNSVCVSNRPELKAPPEIFYDAEEACKYTSSSRIIGIQAQLSERAIELLALPDDGVPRLLLDIGCGSGLSGETLSENGHQWIGLDISPSMLDIALEREVEGDLLLGDMGQVFALELLMGLSVYQLLSGYAMPTSLLTSHD
ncbi:uncharacterized protein LOC123194139 [Mangifera indica]|uniref:uncharacterized protein LOC123194139 n=1 Tax=Mangifera indica TaxID=29780 RepID=UPI001CFA9311|nr:uncharacterized protein LOC123194139 [Mangifera indica]